MELKHGTTRKVLLAGRYAFKVPNWEEYRLFLHGLLANMQETRFNRGLTQPPSTRQMMCPVLFALWGGWLVVMPRCEPIARNSFFRLKYKRFTDRGIPVEHKLDSYGRLDGKIIAIDYGS